MLFTARQASDGENLFIVGPLDMSHFSKGVGSWMSFRRTHLGETLVLETYDMAIEIELKSFNGYIYYILLILSVLGGY